MTISYTQTRSPRKPPQPQESPLSNPSSYCALRTSTDPPSFLIQLWVTERLPMASSREHGKDLPSVQLLMKKNQVRQRRTAKKRSQIPHGRGNVFLLKIWGFSESPQCHVGS